MSSSTDRVTINDIRQESQSPPITSSIPNQLPQNVNNVNDFQSMLQNISIETLKNLQLLQKLPPIKSISDVKDLENIKTPTILLYCPPTQLSSSQQQQQQQRQQVQQTNINELNKSNALTNLTSPVTKTENPYDMLKNASSVPVVNVSSTVKDGNEENRERIFHCPYDNCNKTYFKNSHLKTHIRSHTGKFILFDISSLGKSFYFRNGICFTNVFICRICYRISESIESTWNIYIKRVKQKAWKNQWKDLNVNNIS